MMNFTTTATFLATSNYADQVNSRYNKSQSHYVNIQQRIKQSLQNKTFEKQIVQESVEEFQRRNPHIKTWIINKYNFIWVKV